MAAVAPGEVESRSFWRSPDIPGFELLEAKASSASWWVYNVQYAISIPETWAARVNHDGRPIDLSPGHAFMPRPGEFHSSAGAARPGNLRAIIMSDAAIEQYAGEYLAHPSKLDWKASHARCSSELVDAYHRVFSALHSVPTAMQFQSTMVDFLAVMVPEMIADPRLSEKLPEGSRQAARMRELMHHSPEGLTIGLSELADAVGMTRFQALRAFKRRYGVPPHSYQLAVRVGLAIPLLIRGESVTRVAHELGFTDQSHFTRHFKRIWHMTPGSYAHGARPVPFALRSVCTAQSDGVSFSL